MGRLGQGLDGQAVPGFVSVFVAGFVSGFVSGLVGARMPCAPAPARRFPGGVGAAGETTATGGQSVADLLARLQVQPSEGGRRRRREG